MTFKGPVLRWGEGRSICCYSQPTKEGEIFEKTAFLGGETRGEVTGRGKEKGRTLDMTTISKGKK